MGGVGDETRGPRQSAGGVEGYLLPGGRLSGCRSLTCPIATKQCLELVCKEWDGCL